jgi:hypothetical protein
MQRVISDIESQIAALKSRRSHDEAETARRLTQLEKALRLLRSAEDPARAPAPVRPIRGHLRDRVLAILRRAGSGTLSEIRLVLGGSAMAYEIQNALRDLRDRGLAAPTGATGAVITGRGRAPLVWAPVRAAQKRQRSA